MEDDKLEAMFNSLTGKYKHYCYEWDFLPVDETMVEFAFCDCHPVTQEILTIKEELKVIIEELSNNGE